MEEIDEMTGNRGHKDQLSVYLRLYMLQENMDTCPGKAFHDETVKSFTQC
jgi:hypothetical protein